MFDVGARVRTREKHREGHTRLPKYLERRIGRVIRVLGRFRFADDAAAAGSSAPEQMLYTVEFEQNSHRICADLFESYLEIDA
jgi:nitrile hydratase subunit beta